MPRAPEVIGQLAHSVVIRAAEASESGLPADCLFTDFDGDDPELYCRPDGTAYVCGMSEDPGPGSGPASAVKAS